MSQNEKLPQMQLSETQMVKLAGVAQRSGYLGRELSGLMMPIMKNDGRVPRESVSRYLGTLTGQFQSLYEIVDSIREECQAEDLNVEEVLGDIDDMFKGGAPQ